MKWKKSVEARFWEKVEKRGLDECWPWTGAHYLDKSGGKRGQIWDGRRVIPAPKMSLILSGVKVGKRLALHQCNNSICVNPKHLYPGTFADNVRDSIAAGTFKGNPAPRGEDNYCAKLKSSDVISIRKLVADGQSQRAVARQFSVTPMSISKILKGHTWSHV